MILNKLDFSTVPKIITDYYLNISEYQNFHSFLALTHKVGNLYYLSTLFLGLPIISIVNNLFSSQ